MNGRMDNMGQQRDMMRSNSDLMGSREMMSREMLGNFSMMQERNMMNRDMMNRDMRQHDMMRGPDMMRGDMMGHRDLRVDMRSDMRSDMMGSRDMLDRDSFMSRDARDMMSHRSMSMSNGSYGGMNGMG